MALLTAEKLVKAFTHRKLLDDTGFSIQNEDKIGVIGVNGTGKTTLLRILTGEEDLDSGKILKSSGMRIGYLPQNPDFSDDATVLGQVMLGVSSESKEAKEYECKTILTKLELLDFQAKIGTLSGGQKKRVALAAALVLEVELLILDEPTNHIDSEMVSWLEAYLKSYKGAVIMVTHDRYFLDRVTNRILELDRGKIFSYPCNYSKFLELKAQREEMETSSERKRQSLIRREVEWINQGPCGRGTKSQYRIDRLEKLRSQNVDLSKANVELSSMSSRLGRKIVEINAVSKSFGDKHLIKDFTYLLLRNDRVGIIGRNGIGKSTLLKMIMGQLAPDSGEVVTGETVKIGYFSQECEDMDPAMRPIDYVKQHSNSIETPDGVLTASQLLEKFLFFSDLQYSTISRLSGGERRRLYLLKILIEAPNVLILDEPTNDLDIETLTILEDYLTTFPGAVIMVSHDRYFLDKTATRIFAFENGKINSYMGGYTDYIIQKEDIEDKPQQSAKAKKVDSRERTEKLKFTFKEKNEFEVIDENIAQKEAEISQCEKDLEKNLSNFERLQELTDQKETKEKELEQLMERWVYLNDLNDRINQV